MDVLSHYGDELLRGAIVTAEPGRVRIRPGETVVQDAEEEAEDET